MTDTMTYIFSSTRLGFRSWRASDLDAMSAISGDEKVMKFFPSTQSREHTERFIRRMQAQFKTKKYCFFAVDELASRTLIGFIGLSTISYEADFTPAVEIGWRLAPQFWNQGYATEGAKRCLTYGFEDLGLSTIYATTPVQNVGSENVMKKIGMKKLSNLKHPSLADCPQLEDCLVYMKQH